MKVCTVEFDCGASEDSHIARVCLTGNMPARVVFSFIGVDGGVIVRRAEAELAKLLVGASCLPPYKMTKVEVSDER